MSAEREPTEGTPVTILADAVNRLAWQVELLACNTPLTERSIAIERRGNVRRGCIAIRERIAELIPE